ncbi:hypothetical protein GLU64_02200 [Nanohaloarchaea archaeon]|nr:hypothetical protein [Candidatus Nanohaloarchaea archaeon]
MSRKLFLLTVFLSYTASASAQITSGYGSTRSIPEMINHLLGINVYNPYEILGITATFGVLWVSTYIVFKIAVRRIDEGLDTDGFGSNGGLSDTLNMGNTDSTNLLAVLSLLIVLTIIGTGAFMDIIVGWQSLIILALSFALLAGVFFVTLGGTGAVIGGSAYAAGASAQLTAGGVEQLDEGLSRIADLELSLRDDEQNTDGPEDVEYDEEELEQILEALEEAADDLDQLTNQEIEELGEAVENLEDIIDLLRFDN